MYYKVASSQLPAPQIAPRTKVVLESRQFSSSSSPDTPRTKVTTKSPVLSFQLHRLLRVLKLYYKVASSHLPAPQILRVLKLHYKVASSQLPAPQMLRVLKLRYKVASSQLPAPQIAPRTKVVPQSRQFSSSSSPDTPRTKVVLEIVASCHLPAPQSHSRLHLLHRHARSPQRVARDKTKSYSRLHFAHSTRTISAEGCPGPGQIALSPAFRALDTHDLRRGLRRTKPNRTLACISRTRHARSPQRVARDRDKSHSRLHFAHSTRTISAEGCPRQRQIALSPAFRALDTHDLRRGLRRTKPNRILACISRTRHARSPQRVAPDKTKSHSRLHFVRSTRTILRRGLRFVALRRHCPRP